MISQNKVFTLNLKEFNFDYFKLLFEYFKTFLIL